MKNIQTMFWSILESTGIICLNICLTQFTMKYISLPGDNVLKDIINCFASFGLTVLIYTLLLFIIEKLKD